jgi:PhoH-like ATPase
MVGHKSGHTGPANGRTVKKVAHSQRKEKKRVTGKHIPKQKSQIPPGIRRVEKQTKEIITYVLDSNVLMSDWSSLFKFEEHFVYLVSQVWNELDKHKEGRSDKAFNVRKTIRVIDGLLAKATRQEIQDGIVLTPPPEIPHGMHHTGKLVFYYASPKIPESNDVDLSLDNPDDRIIMACLTLQEEGRRVVLVSNDGNCRVKALVCGLEAEEYLNEAMTNLPSEEDVVTGFHTMGDDFWDKLGDNFESGKNRQADWYEFNHAMFKHVYIHQFIILPNDVRLRVIDKPSPHKVVAESFSHHDYRDVAEERNIEQGLALELLMDISLPAASLAGLAGSGKTYLALATAIELVLHRKVYERVIVTRSTTDADEEIGFLPGTEEEKMSPWLGGIFDNLESLARNEDFAKEAANVTREVLTRKLNLQIKSLNYMKGRSFEKTLIIVDEVQDLNRRKLKMIASRVGAGSKIIFLGNVAQIDNHLVTENTCGMSILISAFADSTLMGHVTLQQGERSAFATEAEERL